MFIREYQLHVQCDHDHDPFFFSGVEVESSQELFGSSAVENYPTLDFDIQHFIPPSPKNCLEDFAAIIRKRGRLVSDSGAAIKTVPTRIDLGYALAGNTAQQFIFMGLRVTPETIDFAFLDQIACRKYTTLAELDEDDERQPDYGLWLCVPAKAISMYDIHLGSRGNDSPTAIEAKSRLKHNRVTIQPRADFVCITRETYASTGSNLPEKDIYRIDRIRDKNNLAVVNIKEIRR